MNLKSIFYNSRDLIYKNPFGAQPQGTEIKFAISAEAGSINKARLVVQTQKITGNLEKISYSDTIKYPLKKSETDNDKEFWSYKVKFNNLNVYGYYFEIEDENTLIYYGNNDQDFSFQSFRLKGTNGVGKVYKNLEDLIPYTQSIYNPEFKTPDWAKDIIYYYIFPERFKNGDKSNDPKPGKRKFYGDQDIEFHENWNDEPYVPGDPGADDIYCNDFFGGDLQGIIEKLDYLKDLGINTIYLNPIFQAVSNHKYDTTDYMKIDEAFGTNELFQHLVNSAKEKGIRIILDTSLNHCGSDSIYMDRYSKYEGLGAFKGENIQKDSPYYDWFVWREEEENPDRKYEQWANPSLATLRETDSYKDFAYRSEKSVTKYWLNMGIGGWRMDVAPWKSDTFWIEWRREVKEANKEALTVCETWFDSSKYLLGNMFDSTMNYLFRFPIFEYAKGGDARSLVNVLEMVRENYPKEAFYCLMNLLSTHDSARALYEFGFKDKDESKDNIDLAKKRLIMCTFFQMTYPGTPTIYYGDEVGVTGGDDPKNRATYPWEEDGGKPDYELLEEFKSLTRLRNENKILRRGDIETIYADENVVVMLRSLNNQYALVAVNNSTERKKVSVNIEKYNMPYKMINPLKQEDVIERIENKFFIDIEPVSGRVYFGEME